MNSATLTPEEAWGLLEKAGTPDWVVEHSQRVAGLALAMARRAADRDLDVDLELVEVGAILHDIGRSITQDVRHATLGADLLRQRGVNESLALVVERHTGAGIDASEAAALGLQVRDYTPRSLAERLVAHADNLYSGSRRLSLAELRAKYQAKGLDRAMAKIDALHADLCSCLGCDLERLEPAAMPASGR